MAVRSIRQLSARRSPDGGFTLVEVVLAMFIVMLVMASLIGVLLSSLGTVTQARQRQTATALATQALERLRALPYDEVTQSTGTPYEAGLGYITTVGGADHFQPTAVLPGVNELLVVNDWSGQWEDQAVDGVTYRIQTYVTRPAATASGQQAFNLTALVSWTSSASDGTRTTAQRSVAYSPAGCLSTAQSPFAAPCQAYFTARAGAVLGGLSVANPIDSTLALEGFESGRLLDLSLASLSSNLLVEQTATATADAQTTGARSEGSATGSSGGVAAGAAVDSDPSSATGQSEDVSTTGHTSGPQSVAGAAGTLSVRPSTADSGRAAAAIAASNTICTGINGLGLVTGDAATLRPCASSRVQPSGSGASVTWSPPISFGGVDVPVATLEPSGSAWRSVAANLTSANSAACTAGSGPTALGCAHAAATRSLGDVVLGAGAGAAAPAGWNVAHGVVHVDGLTETAIAEDGTGASSPSYSRSGTLYVWNGTAHEPIALATAGVESRTIPATTHAYTGTSGITLYVTYEGTVSMQPPQLERTPTTRSGDVTTDCKATACVTRAAGGGGVVANITVTITEMPFDPASTAPPLGRFTIGANLGGLLAQASYKAAPNA